MSLKGQGKGKYLEAGGQDPRASLREGDAAPSLIPPKEHTAPPLPLLRQRYGHLERALDLEIRDLSLGLLWLEFWAFPAVAQVQSLVEEQDPTSRVVPPKKERDLTLPLFLTLPNGGTLSISGLPCFT